MNTKVLALVIQSYLITKVLTPPTRYGSIRKVLATEGLSGALFQFFFIHLIILSAIVQALLYIYVMYQQKFGLIPILSNKFYEWSSLEIICFLTTTAGCLLRVWCFKCLREFFTFNVTIKNNHKLITTGPYSLLAHPSYTGVIMMLANTSLLWYQLYTYIPIYASGSLKNLLNLAYCYFVFQSVWTVVATLNRVSYEEKVLKKNFGKDWDVYFSQRKRFIPFLI